MNLHDTTAMPNWVDPMTTNSVLIRPTPLERLHGRLMRAPDHDAGTDAGSDGGADAGGGDSDAPTADAGDTPGDGAGGDADGSDADGSLIAKARAKSGAGKDGEGEGGDKADTDGKDADADDKADGPPEAYDLKLVVAGEDGAERQVEIDAKLVAEATPVLKELGLTNEQANKLPPLVRKVQERLLEQQASNFETVAAGWVKESKADPEIGGKNWDTTEHLVAKAMDRFDNPKLAEILEDGRLGNHPGFVRLMRDIGSALGEDNEFPRGGGPTEKRDTSAILYPDDVPQTK